MVVVLRTEAVAERSFDDVSQRVVGVVGGVRCDDDIDSWRNRNRS